MFGIQIKRAKEIQLKEMESYLQQNANKVDAVAKEKEAGQNQKENRKAQKVRFYHSQVRKILNLLRSPEFHLSLDNFQRTFGNS